MEIRFYVPPGDVDGDAVEVIIIYQRIKSINIIL